MMSPNLSILVFPTLFGGKKSFVTTDILISYLQTGFMFENEQPFTTDDYV